MADIDILPARPNTDQMRGVALVHRQIAEQFEGDLSAASLTTARGSRLTAELLEQAAAFIDSVEFIEEPQGTC